MFLCPGAFPPFKENLNQDTLLDPSYSDVIDPEYLHEIFLYCQILYS
jgi:hypothetical protein